MTGFAAEMANDWQDGEVRDIDREMMHLTLQIVGKTLFSANVEDDANKIGEAMTTLIKMFNYLLLPFSEILEKLPIPHARRFNQAKETLDAVIYEIINERRKSGAVDKGDLLSMLLMAQDEDDGGGMTDRQVRDECLTLFLAGHETTANALVWTFYCLSQNPETEAKLHEELDRVLQNKEVCGGNWQSGSAFFCFALRRASARFTFIWHHRRAKRQLKEKCSNGKIHVRWFSRIAAAGV
jgi:cytochrome P450